MDATIYWEAHSPGVIAARGKYQIPGFEAGTMTVPQFIERAASRVHNVGAKFGISPDFIRFGIVGTMGFCWDTGTVYALRHLVNLYIAGSAGYMVSATSTWAVNRFWTFRHRQHGAMHRQWLKFVLTNLVGFTFNRGVFFVMITVSETCRREPVFAVALGSFAGLGFNYVLSKRFVFAEVKESP